MTNFWIITLVLSAFAIALALWPWLQRRQLEAAAAKLTNEERIRANVRIHKERLRELNSDRASGQISDEEFEALKSELEANLLNDAQMDDASTLSASGNSTLLGLGLIAVLVVAGSVTLYTHWGAYDAVESHQATRFSESELATAQALAEAGDTRGLLLQLRDKLRNSPQNIEGWSLLANSAMNAQMFDIALEAYDNLLSVEADEAAKAALFGLKAQALYFQGNELNSPEIREATASALSINKDETNTLGLLAIASFEASDFNGAIKYWLRILEVFPEHPSKGSIQLGIDAAKRAIAAQQGGSAEVEQSNAATAEDEVMSGSGGISIDLTISKAVLDALSGDEQVVVFAKATQGPPMPLAVKRFPPTARREQIVLNDSSAMMPELRLSLFELVDVTVRITSGGVERQVGDYELIVTDVVVGVDSPAELSIELTDSNKILSK